MSEIHLNRYEKEKRVIELHLAGKTIREIAKELHMSFTPISKIIKAYERKKELQAKREENNQNGQIKKISLSSRAFKLFRDGKKLTDVAIDLGIPAKRALRLWSQFLRLERMYECYEFYKDYRYDIPTLLSINNFMKRNSMYGKEILNVVRTAKDVANLNQIHSNLKTEIEKLKQTKNNYSLNKNTTYQQPVPLGPLPRYYNW
jgi:DNA-binding Lrp family transcriptional regulator